MENVTPFKPKTKRFSNPDATGQSPDENLSSQSGTENWLNSSRQSGLGQSWNPPGDHGDVDSLARWGFGQQQPMVDISSASLFLQ